MWHVLCSCACMSSDKQHRHQSLRLCTIRPFKGHVHTLVALQENSIFNHLVSVYLEYEQSEMTLGLVVVTAAYWAHFIKSNLNAHFEFKSFNSSWAPVWILLLKLFWNRTNTRLLFAALHLSVSSRPEMDQTSYCLLAVAGVRNTTVGLTVFLHK